MANMKNGKKTKQNKIKRTRVSSVPAIGSILVDRVHGGDSYQMMYRAMVAMASIELQEDKKKNNVASTLLKDFIGVALRSKLMMHLNLVFFFSNQ